MQNVVFILRLAVITHTVIPHTNWLPKITQFSPRSRETDCEGVPVGLFTSKGKSPGIDGIRFEDIEIIGKNMVKTLLDYLISF